MTVKHTNTHARTRTHAHTHTHTHTHTRAHARTRAHTHCTHLRTRTRTRTRTRESKERHLLGHCWALHDLDSIEGPRLLLKQPRPPLDGGGLVHILYLCCSPPPQVMSHEDQLLQGVNPPCTAVKNMIMWRVRKTGLRVLPTVMLCERFVIIVVVVVITRPWAHYPSVESIPSNVSCSSFDPRQCF